jgi:Ice-binding-like
MKFRGTCLLVFLALGLNAYAQAPNLKTAGNFAVLAGAGVTSSDAGTTIVGGSVGSDPTPTINGLLASQVSGGTLYTAANAVVIAAKTDLTAAYNDAAGRSSCTALTGALGGATNPSLTRGVYCYSSAAQLNGTLTLTGNSTDVWIFQIGSTLTTATGATVAFAGGASPCNVFWQVGSSATIQTGNTFAGVIMALTDITLNGGTLNGRALARNGAVTITGKETIISGCSASGSSIVLSPVNSSIVCPTSGASITKTAVVLSNGNPVVGTTVTFTITGPDSAQSGTKVTDASGTATFTITAPSGCSAADTVVATIGAVSSNTGSATFSGPASGSFCATAASPTVTLATVTAGPPKQVVLSVQSPGGLTSVVVNTPPTTNATVPIPTFDNGTTLAVGVTGTKITQSARAVVELTVIDLCGHPTVFDPVSATVTIPAFKSNLAAKFDFDHWEVARFDGIGHTEGMVFLQNDTPGVELLVIRVNGSQFTTQLSDGERKKIDISSALFHGHNTVRVAVFGDPGSSVDLTISDGPSSVKTLPVSRMNTEPVSRRNTESDRVEKSRMQ